MRGRQLMLFALGLALAGCDQGMTNQPRYEAYERAEGWPDDQSARQPMAGTVARDERLGPIPDRLPMALDRALLEQGREGYEVFCTPCHGATGYGEGMVVQRGFPAPPSLHSQRLRAAPPKYFYTIITRGIGAMAPYNARVPVPERWAIAAYIKALQLSQHARPADLTEAQQAQLPARGERP